MVVIRLSRGGAKNRPFFNMVVADSRNRRDGRFIERIGFYNSIATEKQEALRLDLARVTHWQSKGAQLSDTVTRLDRTELALNENAPGDPRDTTTPEQAVASLRHFLVDGAYNPANRAKLIFWMVACQTGLSRLLSGLPLDWRAGDKTGTSDDVHNATIDVAIAWPPGRAPILIACFFSDSVVDLPARNAAHAEIARIVVETWG